MTHRFILLLLSLSQGVQAAEVIPVTIAGDNSYPPYSYAENGLPTGIYHDMIRAAGDKMPGYDIHIEALPWKRALFKVKNDEVPFVYPPYRREQERPYLRYSKPLMVERKVMFCHRALLIQKRQMFPDDFTGLIIGRSLGYAVNNKITLAAEQGLITLTSSTSADTALRRLSVQKLDCYVNSYLSILYGMKTLQASGGVNLNDIVETIQFSEERTHLGASKNNQAFPFINDFLQLFNRHLEVMKHNGELEAIISRYTLIETAE